MSRQSIPFDGFPAPAAAAIKIDWRGDHFGPNNTYQAGGYNLNASSLGMSNFEFVEMSAFSQTGNYYARATFPANSGNSETRAIPPTYVVVKWYIAANGVEVSNNNTVIGGECSQLWASGI